MNAELSNLVDEFLYLVEVGSGSALADESELAHLLDRIALAMRLLVLPEEPSEPLQIPTRDVDVLKKVATSRFATFGSYRRAAHPTASAHPAVPEFTHPAVPEFTHAVDDVAVMADHLHAVAWLWRNSTWDAGLWYLAESYWNYWGVAMRALQLYLHVRNVERERAES